MSIALIVKSSDSNISARRRLPVVLPPDRSQCPWVLGHICSRWRQILWGMQEIWANFQIRGQWLGEPTSLCEKGLEKAINDVISRINPQDASLTIQSQAYICTPTHILPLIHRIRTLSIQRFTHQQLRLFLELPAGSFDSLKTLEKNLVRSNELAEIEATAYQIAPNLRRISITLPEYMEHYPPDLLLYPWPKLTYISLINVELSPRMICTILRQCVALFRCELTVGLDSSGISTGTIVNVAKLQKLTLEQKHPLDWEWFLTPIRAPIIEEPHNQHLGCRTL